MIIFNVFALNSSFKIPQMSKNDMSPLAVELLTNLSIFFQFLPSYQDNQNKYTTYTTQ